MSLFDADFESAFLELEEALGDPVTVTTAANGPIGVTAIIERTEPEDRQNNIPGARAHCIVTLANNAWRGIDAARINRGSDRLSFAYRANEQPRDWKIEKILYADASCVRLQVV